ncbi:hypothetical protein A0J61_03379 [Choanephora cucurbitarum]|uniref:C2H2-type domain-containing protein n=1 Tax=Choanephora cucurbitarum TaxID=101091 RepID=A0A1C7NHR0_9FUNG|nr:hypothetical protein A0J61_03379 [Choanephora cucurbitarum]
MSTVYISNTCFECHREFANAPYLIRHLQARHDIRLNSRPTGQSRPKSKDVRYITDPSQIGDSTIIKLGCPSCWFECPQDSGLLKRHVVEAHTRGFNYESSQQESEDNERQQEMSNENEEEKEDNRRQRVQQKEKDLLQMVDELVANFKSLFPKAK